MLSVLNLKKAFIILKDTYELIESIRFTYIALCSNLLVVPTNKDDNHNYTFITIMYYHLSV